jgi:hypothetical protein
MLSSLLTSLEVMEFHTTEAYSSLDLTELIYSIKRLSRDEMEVVRVSTRPHNLYLVKIFSQHVLENKVWNRKQHSRP